MVILELEELQTHDILAIRVSILTFNSIISPRVIVTIETTLYNHTVKKTVINKKCIEHYETSGNVRVRINASFGSHLNISSVVSLNTPEMVSGVLVWKHLNELYIKNRARLMTQV